MATESNVRRTATGTRTYRGRTLAELLPRIREELGEDAVILREREGLVGGVGGFFAQRFVEVEARRGDGQSIDIYDDASEDDLESDGFFAIDDEPRASARAALLPPEPVDLRATDSEDSGRQPGAPEPQGSEATAQPAEPRPFVPPSVTRDPPDKATQPQRVPAPAPEPRHRAFETEVFLERLRAASAVLPDEEEVESYSLAADPQASPDRASRDDGRSAPLPDLPEPPAERPARQPARRQSAPPPRPKPAARQPGARSTPKQPRSRPQSHEQTVVVAGPSPRPAAAPPPVEQVLEHREPSATAKRGATATNRSEVEAAAARAAETRRSRPPSLRAGLPTEPAVSGRAPSPAASPVAMPAPVRGDRGRERPSTGGLIRGVLQRLFGARLGGSGLPRPSPPRPLDQVAAAQIRNELSTRGASAAWTSQLIDTAGAHGSPLAGDLRAAAEAEVARRIVPAPALPATGAAVAFIGSGGAGKTRCTAALASAYRRASTLGVTVVALDDAGARELGRLLASDGVPVLSLTGEHARRAVQSAREHGFVIVDTPTATPTDPAALDALGAMLAPLALDATFVTLPATLGQQAARRALAGFGQLQPTAIAITHVDETDQLAVIVEIAVTNRIPLAYLHGGTDHRSALRTVEAAALAHQLLSP